MSATTRGAVEVPDIGDFEEVPIIEILVSVGDTVSAEDPLVTLESDKATMDVPAPFGGVVREITVSIGDRVAQGSALMVIDGERESADVAEPASTVGRPSAPEPAPEPQGAPEAEGAAEPGGEEDPTPPAPAARSDGSGPIYASPSVRRLARELGVDLHGVDGSGRKGRITSDDVRGIADGSRPDGRVASGGGSASGGATIAGLDMLPWPTVDFEKFGPVERVPRSRIQRISAPNLARNWVMIPHVTHNDEADVTDLEAWRKQLNQEQASGGVKFTMVSFLVKACVAALREFPDVNASLDGDELVRKRYYNIGFAADTPGGLVVPVIKGADAKGLAEIATELGELSTRAREGKLAPGDMSGSTFTISSLGGIGGTSFTPIVNAPEVAILGVTRSAIKPVWNGTEFVPRLMVPLSFSYDHRVIDGAAAARFVAHLVTVLSDLRRALL